MTRIGIIEDNVFLLNNYKEFFQDYPDLHVAFCHSSIESFEQAAEKKLVLEAEIVLLDISLPGRSGLEGIRTIRGYFPQARILMLSAHDNETYVVNAIRNGACGYIMKNGSLLHLYQAIRDVQEQGASISPRAAYLLMGHLNTRLEERLDGTLTKREIEIVHLLKEGLTYKEMADKMFVSAFTINHHLKKIYQKLNVQSRGQLISRLMQNQYN